MSSPMSRSCLRLEGDQVEPRLRLEVVGTGQAVFLVFEPIAPVAQLLKLADQVAGRVAELGQGQTRCIRRRSPGRRDRFRSFLRPRTALTSEPFDVHLHEVDLDDSRLCDGACRRSPGAP